MESGMPWSRTMRRRMGKSMKRRRTRLSHIVNHAIDLFLPLKSLIENTWPSCR